MNVSELPAFQFHYGSVKRKERYNGNYNNKEISIPLWFG